VQCTLRAPGRWTTKDAEIKTDKDTIELTLPPAGAQVELRRPGG
jgi:hypothetical protein